MDIGGTASGEGSNLRPAGRFAAGPERPRNKGGARRRTRPPFQLSPPTPDPMADAPQKTTDDAPETTPPGTTPDASVEPAAQATAPAADSTPAPLPADYEMPDDYASDDPVAQVKAWVEEHPGLAILGAAGIGLLAGRIVSGLFSEPEPTLSDRVEHRARLLQKEAAKRGKTLRADASRYADGAGDSLQESLHRAAEALKEAASHAGDAAEEGYEKTKDLAETIADAAKVAVTGVVATKIDDWIKKVRD